MKVILLKDVPKVGRKFEAVTVSDGYANNYLFPKRYAEVASEAKLAELEKRRETARAAEDARTSDLREKLEALVSETLTLTVKADDQGHLFKKIRPEDIAEALEDEHGVELSKDSILLDTPIHEVGEYHVPIEAAGTSFSLSVAVVKE